MKKLELKQNRDQIWLTVDGVDIRNNGCLRSKKGIHKGYKSAIVLINTTTPEGGQDWYLCQFSKSDEPKLRMTKEEMTRWEVVGTAKLKTK